MPGNPRQRRSLVALLTAVALTAASSALLALAVETEWLGLRDPLYSEKAELLQRTWAADPTALKVLALGSSRTAYGLYARPASDQLALRLGRPVRVFNFGVPAAGPFTQWLYLRRLLASGVRPDFVLVEVLPPFLAGQMPHPPEAGWLLPTRLRPGERRFAATYGIAVAEPRKWATRCGPWSAYRIAVLDEFAPGFLPGNLRLDRGHGRWLDDCGSSDRLSNPVGEDERRRGIELTRRQFAAELAGYRPGGIECAALAGLVAECRERNLPVALVLPPETTDFHGWFSPPALADLNTFLQSLGHPFIDARAWVPDELFADGHHLTRPGADRYSARLAEVLVPHLTPIGGRNAP